MEIITLCILANLQITYSKLIMELWKTFASHVQNFICPIQLTYSKLHTQISQTYKRIMYIELSTSVYFKYLKLHTRISKTFESCALFFLHSIFQFTY